VQFKPVHKSSATKYHIGPLRQGKPTLQTHQDTVSTPRVGLGVRVEVELALALVLGLGLGLRPNVSSV